MAKNNYWMKLWFEILGDPKMGRLPDRLWRRVIELFLIAGQHGEGGNLPALVDMAWQLKLSEKALQTDLEKIQETGIVRQSDDGSWMVTNFQKRNESVTGTQRVKDFRDRTRYESCNADVTTRYKNSNADVTTRNQEAEVDTEVDTDTELKTTTTTADADFSKVVRAYEDVIGVLTGFTAEKLKLAVSEYEASWIIDALKEAATSNVRKWSYVEAILKRWKSEGRNSKRSNNGHKPTKPLSASLDEILDGAPIFAEDK